jgi:CBS domain-containing protein
MRSNTPTVPPDISVASLVHDHVMGTDERAFPVIESDRLAGLVTLEDIRKVQREDWDKTTVRPIMTPADKLVTTFPREDAAEALDQLAQKDVRQIPVLEGGRLVGMLRRRDIIRFLQLQSGFPARRAI